MAERKRLLVPPPVRGLSSADPASRVFPENAASRLVNFRPTLRATWLTRKGSALFDTMGGSGSVTGLWSFYRSTGIRTRLAVRGPQLYDLVVGTNTSFQTVLDGDAFDGIDATNLNNGTFPLGPRNAALAGIQAKDLFYISDRQHVLGKYDPTDRKLYEVKQPVAPSTALTVRTRTFRILEDWTGNGGSAPFGWSDTAQFDLQAASTIELPIPGNYVRFDISSSGAKGDTSAEDVTGEKIESNTIAWAFESTTKQPTVAFEIGLTGAGEFSFIMDPPARKRPYLVFFEVGNLATINRKRFRCVRDPDNAQKVWLSALLLPGRLQGKYRWVYTHYRPSTGAESEPSPNGNGDAFYDFSAIGTNYKTEDQQALRKSASLVPTSDSGTDSTTTKICIYRQGGDTPALFKDSRGIDRYFYLVTIDDFSTTINDGSVAAGDTTFDVASIGAHSSTAAGFAVGDWVVIEPGVADKEEFVYLSAVAGTTLTFASTPLKYAHSNGVAVQIAYVDNIGNASIDTSRFLEVDRDDPPSGIRFLAKSPDGRLVAMGWTADPMGVAWSNVPTVDRTLDHEVFPDVNPLTRGSLIQGFRTTLKGNIPGDEIIWGDYFQGQLTILTRRALYQVNAFSQADWGPSAIVEVLRRGCIAGETVREVNGQLVWVADGPVVMMWDGQSQPREISLGRITTDLEAAPVAYYSQWFAKAWSDESGIYYRLWFTPEGGTTNTGHWLYSVTADAWMQDEWRDDTDTVRAWTAAMVQEGVGDSFELFAAASDGTIWELETGDDDEDVAISVRSDSARFPLQDVWRVEGFYVRLEREIGVCDLGEWHVSTGGGEYAQTEICYEAELSAIQTGDREFWIRTHYELLVGRWCCIKVMGDFLHRPETREIEFVLSPVRADRIN